MAYTNINKGSNYFNTKLYTGNGSTQSITGVGFQPDWTWIKCRSAANGHTLWDSVRGVTNWLDSAFTYPEQTNANGLTSFDSDGFSVGTLGDVNASSASQVSWNWKAGGTAVSNTDGTITSTVSANTTSGFSIVTYTRTTSGSDTIGHGLGVKPQVVLYKSRSTGSWYFTTDIIDGSYDFLTLNTTDAISNITGASAPTSTVFSNTLFGASENFVAYCFANVKGYSKIGKYTGNGSTDGPFVYTGFKPAFVMHKRTDGATDWFMFDNKRLGYNSENYRLIANSTLAEADPGEYDILSNGFKIRFTSGNVNASGGTYIYMAFAENPFVGSDGTPTTAR